MREMKDSGLRWAGKIPVDWKITKGKYFMSVLERPVKDDDGVITCFRDGIVTLRSNRREDGFTIATVEAGYQGIEPGDLVVHGMDGFAGAIGISDSRGKGTPALNVLDCIEHKRYMMYLLRSMAYSELFMALSTGIRVRTCDTNWRKLRELNYLIPSLDEQRIISEYLDHKSAEIEALTADIQIQIDTLEQYKRSVITETVTKGLNPNAEMKDSGVPWIGMMPAHWDCIRGKYILTYLQKPVKQDDEIITCFRDGEVTLRSNRREDGFTVADKEIGYQGIDVGDLVVHGMDGFAGAIGVSDSRGKASPVLNVLDTEQDKRYIMYFLRSMAYGDVFLALATGIRVRSCDLRWNKLSELMYPIPPLVEQKEIVEYIDAILQKVDDIVTEKKEQLETLDAYKKSLIFEYVTGKKEVPDALMVFGINPHVLRLAIIVDMIKKLNIERKRMGKKALKGKVVNQKFLYLLDEYLEHGLDTRYHRYQNGPFDLQFDSYINILVSNGWYELDTNDGSESLVAGRNHAEFLGRYGNQLTQYKSSVEALTRCFGMMSRRQLEEVATLFAVWNDLIIDGNLAPSNDEIINEAMTNWTPNKGKIPHDTWQNMLMKMKRDGIIPKGLGLHTLPKPDGGKSDA